MKIESLKVIQMLPEFHEGGVERHVLWLSSALAKQGHEVMVVSKGESLKGSSARGKGLAPSRSCQKPLYRPLVCFAHCQEGKRGGVGRDSRPLARSLLDRLVGWLFKRHSLGRDFARYLQTFPRSSAPEKSLRLHMRQSVRQRAFGFLSSEKDLCDIQWIAAIGKKGAKRFA